jgi:Putative Ig domain
MRRSLFLLTFLMTIFCSMLSITSISANDSKDTFFPVARVVLTPVFLSEDAAFSFLAEGGPRSYRFNGTLGYIACEQHRFKVGGEYLGQKLHYKFNTGKEHHWMHQWAVGGKYQYLFAEGCCDWVKSFDLSGYYAKAKSKDLNVDTDDGISEFRRIAGARSWGIEAGASIDTCWNNGSILVAIDYDDIEYKRQFQSHKRVSGVGGTIGLHQPLWCDVVFDFEYQYKRAYDYIEASLDWRSNLECGDLDIGVFANHVFGKERLPSSTTVGIELGFSFGVDNLFGDCCDPCAQDCCVMDCNDLAAWVSSPAVYMPQVLAIVDEAECTPPLLLVSAIPDQDFLTIGAPISIDLNQFFSTPKGSTITYTVTGLPAGVAINSHGIITGLVTANNIGSFLISVSATDGCGSTSTTFTLNLGAA